MADAAYSSFNKIEDVTLQAWNRLMTYLTVMKDIGQEQAKAYLSQFSSEDTERMQNLSEDIQNRGLQTVRQEINRRFEAGSKVQRG